MNIRAREAFSSVPLQIFSSAYTIGGAQVSEKHAGFIINVGGATAKDVLDLVEYIKKVIRENYGVELECEIRRVGNGE